jgi:predicted NUDIX family NTP pyrophosphohydrolase
MPPTSAGILIYRFLQAAPEVLLVHPGGPFWAKKDEGAWSIPKGGIAPGEDPLAAALRELREETGCILEGRFEPLRPVRQPGGKIVHAWAIQGDFDPTTLSSNSFALEWPRGSGKFRQFPEVDRAAWFDLPAARRKILKGQLPLLQELEAKLSPSPS